VGFEALAVDASMIVANAHPRRVTQCRIQCVTRITAGAPIKACFGRSLRVQTPDSTPAIPHLPAVRPKVAIRPLLPFETGSMNGRIAQIAAIRRRPRERVKYDAKRAFLFGTGTVGMRQKTEVSVEAANASPA
jgi:hypothetical protein